MLVIFYKKDIPPLRGTIIFHQFDDPRILPPFLMMLVDEELKPKRDVCIPFSADSASITIFYSAG